MNLARKLSIVAISFLAGTIASGALAFADKNTDDQFSTIVKAIKDLTSAINNKQTTVTVNPTINAPAGPTGPAGSQGPSGPTGPAGFQGIGLQNTYATYQQFNIIGGDTAQIYIVNCDNGDKALSWAYQFNKDDVHIGYAVPTPTLNPTGYQFEIINRDANTQFITLYVSCAKVS